MNNGVIEARLTLQTGSCRIYRGTNLLYDQIVGSAGSWNTSAGFLAWSHHNGGDTLGEFITVSLDAAAGQRLSIRMYDNREWFWIRMDRDGASGETSGITGRLHSGVPGHIMAWWQNESYWEMKHRPLVTALGTQTLRSVFSAAGYDGKDRPALFVGSASVLAYDQEVTIGSFANGMTFDAKSRLDNDGSGQPFFVYCGNGSGLLQFMEDYASMVAALGNVRLVDWIPAGVCTWDMYGDGVSFADVVQIADSLVSMRLRDYGYTLLQIDDGWQYGWRCSGSWWANDKFGGGASDNDAMKATADTIKSRGLHAGIWIGPFNDEDNPDWRPSYWGIQHPEFDPDGGGENYHLWLPEFLAWVGNLTSKITREWGFDYIKTDFLYGGNDNGNSMVFRNAVQTMKNSMREGTYLLNCNSYPWKVIGAGDGMRLGEDVGVSFDLSRPDGSITSALRGAANQWYANGKFWIGDADQVHVRKPLSFGEAKVWASLVGLSGGVVLTGDRFWEHEGEHAVPPERLELLRRIAPAYGVAARPVDLFAHDNVRDNDYPNVFVCPVKKPWTLYYVVAFMNWDASPKRITLSDDDLPQAGSAAARYAAYDFWGKRFLGMFSSSVRLDVPAHDCVVFSLVPFESHPFVVSTSRHITQGGVDLENVSWNEGARLLSGRSINLVPHEPYLIHIYTASNDSVFDANAAGKPAAIEKAGDTYRTVTFTPSDTAIDWQVWFGEPTGVAGQSRPRPCLRSFSVSFTRSGRISVRTEHAQMVTFSLFGLNGTTILSRSAKVEGDRCVLECPPPAHGVYIYRICVSNQTSEYRAGGRLAVR